MTALASIADIERATMVDAARRLGLDASGSHLVSASSRLIWHLPADQVALTITRPGSKTADDIDAEVAAVSAAASAGVHTPPLVVEPTELPDSRFALPYRWIAGRAFQSTDWSAGVAEAAKLAQSEPEGLRHLDWPAHWPDPAWRSILGQQQFAEFGERIRQIRPALNDLLGDENLVLCHGDLQPANFLVDDSGDPWLIDLEYACLAPPLWDAAKLVILSKRFGDPLGTDGLLDTWPSLGEEKIGTCLLLQETQIAAWLLDMALRGATGVSREAQIRATRSRRRWKHV